MTRMMGEPDSLTKLTDAESLSLSESCVKSDIANIIKKIYSPRPLVYRTNVCTTNESFMEYEGNMGDNITVSQQVEKTEKRFGFYFEPVSRRFAKRFVDSSTTSGSVSMPIVRYKPKRLRQVCDCCKRKIPYRDQETRAKRGCQDCRICRRWNEDGGNTSQGVTVDGVSRDRRQGQGCRAGASACEIVQVHLESQPQSTNLERKRSLTNVQINTENPLKKISSQVQLNCTSLSTNLEKKQSAMNVSINDIGLQRNSTQVRLNCNSSLNLPVIPGPEDEKHKTHESSTQTMKKMHESNMSFLHRMVSKIFGIGKLDNENSRSTSKKNVNARPMRKKSSKTSRKMKGTKIRRLGETSSENMGSALNNIPKRDQPSRGEIRTISYERITTKSSNKLTDTLDENLGTGQLTSDEELDVTNVIIHSCPDMAKKKSEFKVDKKASEEEKDLDGIEKDMESGFDKEEEIKFYEKKPEKYQVAYEGLRIERNADWAYEFWGNVFGMCHFVVSFVTAFFLHLLTFLLQSVVQPLFFGTVRVASDHFFKPCLHTAYQSVIEPVCHLIESLLVSLHNTCLPVAHCFGAYCREVSHVCRACRVVEVHKNYHFDEKV